MSRSLSARLVLAGTAIVALAALTTAQNGGQDGPLPAYLSVDPPDGNYNKNIAVLPIHRPSPPPDVDDDDDNPVPANDILELRVAGSWVLHRGGSKITLALHGPEGAGLLGVVAHGQFFEIGPVSVRPSGRSISFLLSPAETAALGTLDFVLRAIPNAPRMAPMPPPSQADRARAVDRVAAPPEPTNAANEVAPNARRVRARRAHSAAG